MAISYIGQGSGVDTATLPTHQADDFILVFAYRDGSTTPPTVPGGFTTIGSAGANSNSEVTAYKFAASSSETIGTWTNATALIVLVYRGVSSSDPIGHTLPNGATATSLIGYYGLTLEVTSGTSWVVAFGGTRSFDTDFENAITTLTLRTNYVDSVCEAVAHDSNGGVSSWSSNQIVTLTTGTYSSYRTRTLELREGPSSGGTPARSYARKTFSRMLP